MGVEGGMLRLAFVGDIALGNHPKTPGFGFYSRYRNGIPGGFVQRILPPGISPDLFFGNLEFALADDAEHLSTGVCCLGSASYSLFLRDSGFTVLNLANNHSWEHGKDRFWQTVLSLKKACIKAVGISGDFDPAGFLRIKDRTVAILGCSSRPRQGFSGSPGYNEFEKDRLLERIRVARTNADLVCVSIHWGEEFVPIPSPWEKELGRAMIEAGASVVVGHHPHVLREVESYRNGVIAYSLGNFIGDMTWNFLTRETGCLIVEADGSRIRSKTFVPAVIDCDYFPCYMDDVEGRRFLKTQYARYARLHADLETCSYETLAKKALKNHQWLTVFFLLRNVFRYPVSALWKILCDGMKVRLQRSRGGW